MNENQRISDQERQKRQKAVDGARASVRLSGFTINTEGETLFTFTQYVAGAGELTNGELNRAVLKLGKARTPEADEGLLTANRIRELRMFSIGTAIPED